MTRVPVTTLTDLDALDDAEILEGYWSGRDGDPEPGDNRSRAFWHGWRNGAVDYGHRQPDEAGRILVHLWRRRERERRDASIKSVETP